MERTERRTTMRKTIATIASAAMVAGGIVAGAALSSPNVAVAQTDETPSVVEEAPATSDEILSGLVSDGVITQEQADAVADALAERGGFRHGHRGHGRGGGHLETAAEIIGIATDTLMTALRDGETIAAVAEANGVDVESVIDALVAEHQEKLDEAVADGRLSQDEADERAADVNQRVTDMVNGELPERGDRGFGRRGFRGPGPTGDAASTSLGV
jgi:polyhydroxyalkanoate synthesis regulator phasin